MSGITLSEGAKAVVRRNTEEVQGRGNFDISDFADCETGFTTGRMAGKDSELPTSFGKRGFRKYGGNKMRGWIGVDLDGTLAKSVKAQTGEEIGVPIHPMVQLVKRWLARGEDVRIFTARVNPNRGQINAIRARRAIGAWCKCHLGQILPVTHEKDWDMVLLFDDRVRQVERDTGRVFCRLSRENRIAQETRTARSGETSQERRVNK
jgi:hypothetical protein